MKHLFSGACLLTSLFIVGAQTNTLDKRFGISAQVSVNYGQVDGFMQVPAGGNPGSSTHDRPTLNELDIDDVLFYDTQVDIRWRSLDVFGGYQWIDFDSSGTLTKPLVSRSVLFPAGTHFQTKDQFDWFRVGAGWKFSFLDHKLELMPKADLAVLDFNYKLSSPSAAVRRSYAKEAGRLGLEGTYRFAPRLALKLDAAGSIPLSNTPQIAAATATLNFDLLSPSAVVRPTLFLGVGYEWIDYEDNQSLPNHYRLEAGPYITAGVGFSF